MLRSAQPAHFPDRLRKVLDTPHAARVYPFPRGFGRRGRLSRGNRRETSGHALARLQPLTLGSRDPNTECVFALDAAPRKRVDDPERLAETGSLASADDEEFRFLNPKR